MKKYSFINCVFLSAAVVLWLFSAGVHATDEDQIRDLISSLVTIAEGETTSAEGLTQSDINQIKDSIQTSESFDIDDFIETWSKQFVDIVDEMINPWMFYSENIYELDNKTSTLSSYPVTLSQSIIELAQDKTIQFMNGPEDPYIPEDAYYSPNQVLENSHPLANNAGYLIQLWLKGMLYPTVRSANEALDPVENLKCLRYYLNEKAISKNPGTTLPSHFNIDVDCQATGELQNMDSHYRFTETEINHMISGAFNGFYLTANDLSASATKSVMDLYMSLSSNKPIVSVCLNVISQLKKKGYKESNADDNGSPLCTEDNSTIEGPCIQCSSIDGFKKLHNHLTSTTEKRIDEITRDKSQSFDHLVTFYDQALMAAPAFGSPDIRNAFAIEGALKSIAIEIDRSRKLLISPLIQQLQKDGISSFDKRINKSSALMSLQAFFSSDGYFGEDVGADQINCDSLISLSEITDLNAQVVSSNQSNEIINFLSLLSGDLVTPELVTPIISLSTTGESNDLITYPQLWTQIRQKVVKPFFPVWIATPATQDGENDIVSQVPHMINQEDLQSSRSADVSSLTSEGIINLVRSLVLQKANMSTTIYQAFLERVINLSSVDNKYCSVKMLRRKSAQWRFDDNWIDEIWTMEPAGILRHIAQLLAEINYRLHLLYELSVQTIVKSRLLDYNHAFTKMTQVVPELKIRADSMASQFDHGKRILD